MLSIELVAIYRQNTASRIRTVLSGSFDRLTSRGILFSKIKLH